MSGWQHKRAFVIQLQPESDIAAGRFEGRVEHVASGQAVRFHSPDELLSFLDRLLKVARAEQQPPSAGQPGRCAAAAGKKHQ